MYLRVPIDVVAKSAQCVNVSLGESSAYGTDTTHPRRIRGEGDGVSRSLHGIRL